MMTFKYKENIKIKNTGGEPSVKEKIMKNVLLSIALLILSINMGCSNGSGDTVRLKMSVTTSETSTWVISAKKFAEIVKEKTDGKVIIDVYPNEQLSGGNQSKGIEMLSSGITDLSWHSNLIWASIDTKFGVISLPWIYQDENEAELVLDGEAGDAIKELTLEKGVECLAFGESGFRQVSNNKKPILTPKDLIGLKMRVPNINMLLDVFRILGADAVGMNWSEVFTALQQNTIDGQENPLDVMMSAKIEEVQKYLTAWNYCYDALILGINKKKMDSLSSEYQQVIRDAATEAAQLQKSLNREIIEKQFKQLEALPTMQVTYLTPEQISVFREMVIPIYQKYEPLMGKDLIDLFVR